MDALDLLRNLQIGDVFSHHPRNIELFDMFFEMADELLGIN
jgi:hypothetical protein